MATADGLERGAIDLADCPGGLHLQATLESGQSYCWNRADDRLYEEPAGPSSGDAWYHTVVDGEVIRVRQRDGVLEWESTTDAVPAIRELLRLDDDLPAIRQAAPEDDVVQDSFDRFAGLRLVDDPAFRSLISFICSAQMRVERIHENQRLLARTFGESVTVGEVTYHAFPEPEALATTTEERLRELGLGYRAPYVLETARMVAEEEADPEALVAGEDYETAREALTTFVGVGDKVADCVLLFALDRLEAVPLDTWIQTVIEEYYPECEKGTYAETSRAIRGRLGGDVAGYTQTYLFHHLRTREV
jgi:N-glycosylase/DNA lyase